MDNEQIVREYITNADAAFASRQFDVALEWFEKALAEAPDNIYALSRAGAVCVPLKKFNESQNFFTRAMELDPENGDNYFNLANTFFFRGDYTRALELYAEAEIKGCSEDVKPRLYYQLAALCTIKKDAKSALINYKKYEDCNKSESETNDSKVILQKIKLHMMLNEFEKAENCAMQLKAISPGDFKGYALYFQILLMYKKYDKAEEVLKEALEYARLSDDETVTIELDKVIVLVSRAEVEPENADSYYQKALALLKSLENKKNISKSRLNEIKLSSAEIYLKTEKFDEAIKCVNEILNLPNESAAAPTADNASKDYDMYEEDFDQMANEAMEEMEARIANGEISEDMGEYEVEIGYDEDGREVREYPEGVFGETEEPKETEQSSQVPDDDVQTEDEEASPKSSEFYDKLRFILLSCYISKEDYKKALEYTDALKHSENVYYSYFGVYTEAFAVKKLSDAAKFDKAEAERKYAEAIAFFRTKMFENPGDKFAVVFRARLYAESEKFAKASEMANLLAAEEKKALLEYIAQCRKESQGI